MHQYLAAFQAAGRTEGVLFIGRAQEKNTVFRTEKRRAADGLPHPWIVRATSVVNQFYVHCVDEDPRHPGPQQSAAPCTAAGRPRSCTSEQGSGRQ